MFENRKKSTLTFQAEGRLSNYISSIDDCSYYHSDSSIDHVQSMEIPESIHLLLQHIKTNCLKQNQEILEFLKLEANPNSDGFFSFTWNPIANAKTISGIVEMKFIVPDLSYFEYSNFNSLEIQIAAETIIDLMTLSFADYSSFLDQKFFIIKTKQDQRWDKTHIENLKLDLEEFLPDYISNPTMLYLKHKDSSGLFGKHFGNYIYKKVDHKQYL